MLDFQKSMGDRVYAAARTALEARNAPPPSLSEPVLMSLSCGRALWFGVNGVPPRASSGLLARTAEQNRLTRRVMLRDLRRAGFKIEWVGALDCGRIHGLTRRPHLLELVAAPEALFSRLRKFGLGAAIDLEIAMQCRLGLAQMERGLFVAENKNTQELYFEKVCFDEEIFAQVRGRVMEAARLSEPPRGNFDETCPCCGFFRECGKAQQF